MRIPLKPKAGSPNLSTLVLQNKSELVKEGRKKVIIVGGGPAGMMAAWHLAELNEVKLFEKSARLGRKFILAGKGGLNITHEASREEIKRAYSPDGIMDKVLDHFDQVAFREWLKQMGIPTFEGTSGKVFPEKGMEAGDVLKRITDSLLERGVTIYLNHRLTEFSGNMLFTFDVHENGMEEHREVHYDANFAVLALGGASWPQTGSDGKWVEMLHTHSISTLPFQPSNCGIDVNWPKAVKDFHTGKPLKNLMISIETTDTLTTNSTSANTNANSTTNKTISKGEALITDYGLEGTAVYPLIPIIRQLLAEEMEPLITLDFKPQNTLDQLIKKISGKKSFSYGKALALDSAQMAVIKAFTGKEEFMDPARFCAAVKKLLVPLQSLRPVEEAISVIGGIDQNDLMDDFSLKKFPRIFTIGEMVNWDAPTGGYLLQGCFSMGAYVARIINKKPHG